jgi:uncharacterized RDD family membrane protein YckC
MMLLFFVPILLGTLIAIGVAPTDRNGLVTHAARTWITAGLIAAVAAIVVCYFCVANARGTSLGKRGTGIRVVRAESGDAPGGASSIVRTAAQMLTACTLGIGYLIAAFDSQHRTLHDRLAGTIVIER